MPLNNEIPHLRIKPRKCYASTPPDRCADLRHPAGQASKRPLACPAYAVPVSPGQREKPRSPSAGASARRCFAPSWPGAVRPAALAASLPSPTTCWPARAGAARQPYADQTARLLLFCRPTILRRLVPRPAAVPGHPAPQQKQRHFVHLAFLGCTAAITPTVATRSTRIRALKFSLSERVDRSIPGRRQKASQLDRRAVLGLAFCSRPVTRLAAMHFT